MSPRHVQVARIELGALGVAADLGGARQLDTLDCSYDVVSLLGPLYHLTAREDRLVALREAARIARRPEGSWPA